MKTYRLVVAVMCFLLGGCTLPLTSVAPTSPPTRPPRPASPTRPMSPAPRPTRPATPSPRPTHSAPPTTPTATPVTPDNLVTQRDYALYLLALDMVRALAEGDGAALAAHAAPEGVTFSPDIHVDAADQTFSPESLPGLWDDATVYRWGVEAGSGQPIRLTFAGYAARFINDRDYFHAPRIALDTRLGAGNDVDNLSAAWPRSRFVEFHYPGSDQYGGLDWTSLRLVFVADARREWHLRGVFHDAWTP